MGKNEESFISPTSCRANAVADAVRTWCRSVRASVHIDGLSFYRIVIQQAAGPCQHNPRPELTQSTSRNGTKSQGRGWSLVRSASTRPYVIMTIVAEVLVVGVCGAGAAGFPLVTLLRLQGLRIVRKCQMEDVYNVGARRVDWNRLIRNSAAR